MVNVDANTIVTIHKSPRPKAFLTVNFIIGMSVVVRIFGSESACGTRAGGVCGC